MRGVIILLVLVLFSLDMLLTYRYVKSYKKMYPKNDWTLAEANPILRFLMKKLGLGSGICVGGFFILLILLITIGLLPDYYGMFLLGMYFMANTYHFVNWRALERLQFSKNLKGGKKINGI